MGVEKTLVYPLSISFELGLKNRMLFYSILESQKKIDPLTIFAAAGIGIAISDNKDTRNLVRRNQMRRNSLSPYRRSKLKTRRNF